MAEEQLRVALIAIPPMLRAAPPVDTPTGSWRSARPATRGDRGLVARVVTRQDRRRTTQGSEVGPLSAGGASDPCRLAPVERERHDDDEDGVQ